MRRLGWSAACAALATCIAGTAAAVAQPVDPVVESQNYSKTLERQALYDSPQRRLLLTEVGTRNSEAAVTAQAKDPERQFADDLCWNGGDGCAGDARLYNYRGNAYAKMMEYDKAIADYSEAIHFDPNFATAYRNRANAFALQGDAAQATADREKAAALEAASHK